MFERISHPTASQLDYNGIAPFVHFDYSVVRVPSIKSLMEIKDVTRVDAVKVRAILKMTTCEQVTAVSDAARDYFQKCYHRPPLQLVKLYACDTILRTFGVEGIGRGHNQKSPAIDYLNTGDTYASTLLWVRGAYRVGSWGDIVERGNYE